MIEFDCNSDKFPDSFTWATTGGQGTGVGYTGSAHNHQLGVPFGGFDVGDMNDDGIIDVVAINQGNTECKLCNNNSINSHI